MTSLTESGSNNPLQKRIVLFLAKNDPQTVNETCKLLNGSYKCFWNAFNSLKEKNVIQIVSAKSYKGRKYPRYWISTTGVLLALFEGVSSKNLLEKSLVIYPKDTNLQVILEVSPILGTEAFRLAYQVLLTKGKLEQSDITNIIFAEMQEDLDSSQIEPLLFILKNIQNNSKLLKHTLKV